MTGLHARSPSPGTQGNRTSKRLKTDHPIHDVESEAEWDPTPFFATHLLDSTNVEKLRNDYTTSEPFRYVLVEQLFQDDLLQKVKDECLNELHFTEKETDIYKVNQTGDLASLSYLTKEQIALLPNLLKLRDALYSSTFRAFVRSVTGCGPLSGQKQDMSVNTYKQGCHLLNHDDVIGTRRVSYILYMPLPRKEAWCAEWGGALELYPVCPGPDGTLEPEPVPSKSIPPSWNQFIFFEVQPGRSFHSVEEVVIQEGEEGRQRLSISGWFHTAQPGEEGHTVEDNCELKSSREQLVSTSTVLTPYPDRGEASFNILELSEEHITFLSEYLNPIYLQPRVLQMLATRFGEEVSLELHDFLHDSLAASLDAGLRALDERDGLSAGRTKRIPPHSAGSGPGFVIKGPPHKWRYSVLAPLSEGEEDASAGETGRALRLLQDTFFSSAAFRAWLSVVTHFLPVGYTAEARRFCPGLGYTLATSEEGEARLDVVLGLTPQLVEAASKGKGKGKSKKAEPEDVKSEPRGWQTGEWGGWECYMAPHDEEDDPAVYRSGPRRNKSVSETPVATQRNGDAATNGAGIAQQRDTKDGDAVMKDDDDDESDGDAEEADDGGTLLTVQPGFNRLLLVLRDEGVMRFVKYVSAAAEGSRWDICGEYEVGMVEEEAEEDED